MDIEKLKKLLVLLEAMETFAKFPPQFNELNALVSAEAGTLAKELTNPPFEQPKMQIKPAPVEKVIQEEEVHNEHTRRR